ncbi:MAG: efflux RND transporter periplasmic adaptor subunit [Desulfuromonadales bacterium]|nr:efflux RND transporter periplasmic adaptor subunit [Desulfuromonadales bacterium]
MRNLRRISLIFVITIIIGSVFISGCSKSQAPPQSAPEVGVVTMKSEPVMMTTELPGRTNPQLIAEVRPQVNGIIKERFFVEGSNVKAGQVLYKIDPSLYQATYLAAQAALAKSKANLVTTQLKQQRYAELVKINAVSKQDFDDATAALKLAEADVESSQAALDTAKINLGYTNITAPISGRIGKSLVTTGALVTASQATPLAVIQKMDPMYVDVVQPTSELLRLKNEMAAGQLQTSPTQAMVRLILEDGTQYPIKGILKFSDVTVDQSTSSVTLRTVFPNPNGVLLPGMYVQAVIEEGIKSNAILAPQQGVTIDQAGNPTALVVGSEEKVELRTLKLGKAIADKWIVLDGLKPGDRLIVEGVQRAQPGSPVKAVPAGSAPAGQKQ